MQSKTAVYPHRVTLRYTLLGTYPGINKRHPQQWCIVYIQQFILSHLCRQGLLRWDCIKQLSSRWFHPEGGERYSVVFPMPTHLASSMQNLSTGRMYILYMYRTAFQSIYIHVLSLLLQLLQIISIRSAFAYSRQGQLAVHVQRKPRRFQKLHNAPANYCSSAGGMNRPPFLANAV